MMAIPVVVFAAAMVTSTFEGGNDGWDVDGKVCRICDGVGLKGSRGLVWTNDNVEAYRFAKKALAPRPGSAYVFSGWVKAERLVNPAREDQAHANLSIEWRDTAGKWLGISCAKAIVDNQEDQEHGWVKFVGRTQTMPADLGSAHLICSVPKGTVGRVVFDNLEVVSIASDPVRCLVSSAYRDAAVNGKVRFAARCLVDLRRDPPQSLSADFVFTGVDGEMRVKTSVAEDLTVRTEIDVAKLARGTNPVRLEVRRADGGLLGARELAFTRLAAPVARKVDFDGYGRTLVDGKPFFPLGLYAEATDVSELDTYCEGPFNCILPYGLPPKRTALDPYQAKGLKVIVCISDFTGFRGSKLKGRFDERAYVARYLSAMKDHPALLAWYLADELDVAKIPDLRERKMQVHQEDQHHPTYVVFDNPDRPTDFVEGYDVIGMDPYPIGNAGTMLSTLGTCSTYPEAATRGMFGFRAMWQVPQAFNWTWFRSWAEKEGAHMPTLAELRNMNWQAIASGANGLVGWWFSSLIREYRQKGREADFVRAWGDVKTAYSEVAKKVPLILSVEPAPRVAKLPANVSARTWRKDGRVWLLVVNRTYDPVKGTVTLSDGGKVDVSLGGLGYRFIEL